MARLILSTKLEPEGPTYSPNSLPHLGLSVPLSRGKRLTDEATCTIHMQQIVYHRAITLERLEITVLT